MSQITGVNVKTIARGRVLPQLEDDTAGDPMSNKKGSRKDARSINGEVKTRGIEVCAHTVGKLLKDQGYSLRVLLQCET